MSQVQVRTQPSNSTPQADQHIEIKYTTWGSFGQFTNEYVVLRNGTVIDAKSLSRTVRRGDVIIKEINGVKVIVMDSSSRKNTHVTVQIPASEVLAVIEESKSSSGHKGFIVKYGGGEIIAEDEEKVWDAGRIRYVKTVRKYYYVNGDMKVLIAEREVDFQKIKTKLVVSVIEEGNKVYVSGDTYDIKDKLKTYGFRWDPLRKAWYINNLSKNDVIEILKSLDVEVN